MKAYTIDTEFDASDKYIVDNIIARKSITLIVASPKKGKTALGLNLGICINEGIDFLENKVNKTKVVYYCNELFRKAHSGKNQETRYTLFKHHEIL